MIRTLSLGVVAILWVVNGGLLAWVMMNPAPEAPPTTTTLRVFCEKPDQAKKVQKALADAKFTADLQPNQPWRHDVVLGYELRTSLPSEDLAKPLAQAAKMKKLPVRLVGKDLFWGSVFPKKAEAEKAKATAASKGYENFEVEEKHTNRSSKANLIQVNSLSAGDLAKANEILAKLKLKEDQIQTEEVTGGEAPNPAATP